MHEMQFLCNGMQTAVMKQAAGCVRRKEKYGNGQQVFQKTGHPLPRCDRSQTPTTAILVLLQPGTQNANTHQKHTCTHAPTAIIHVCCIVLQQIPNKSLKSFFYNSLYIHWMRVTSFCSENINKEK